jgi:hypothetical protein
MNLELTVGPEFSLEPSVMTNTMFTSLDITVPPVTLPPNPQGLIPVVGLDKFLLLTPEQQASVPDVWQRTTA